jgi:hypothetical protein
MANRGATPNAHDQFRHAWHADTSLVVLEGGQRYWLPAIYAATGDPFAFVKRKESRFATHSLEVRLNEMAERDGIERIRHLGHLFLPYSWIISVNPEAKPYCEPAVRRFLMQGHEQAA